MQFKEEEVETFTTLFDRVKSRIRNFEGCTYLKLMRDHHNPHIFVTYSKWVSQEHLDGYRHSELFKATWKDTKVLFADKPIAFSLEEYSGEVL